MMYGMLPTPRLTPAYVRSANSIVSVAGATFRGRSSESQHVDPAWQQRRQREERGARRGEASADAAAPAVRRVRREHHVGRPQRHRQACRHHDDPEGRRDPEAIPEAERTELGDQHEQEDDAGHQRSDRCDQQAAASQACRATPIAVLSKRARRSRRRAGSRSTMEAVVKLVSVAASRPTSDDGEEADGRGATRCRPARARDATASRRRSTSDGRSSRARATSRQSRREPTLAERRAEPEQRRRARSAIRRSGGAPTRRAPRIGLGLGSGLQIERGEIEIVTEARDMFDARRSRTAAVRRATATRRGCRPCRASGNSSGTSAATRRARRTASPGSRAIAAPLRRSDAPRRTRAALAVQSAVAANTARTRSR